MSVYTLAKRITNKKVTLMTKKFLTYSTAILSLACVAVPGSVNADTVTTQTLVQAKDIPNKHQTDFSVFDANGDGQYSMEEVGEKLFSVFDLDGNHNIDNIEWDKKSMMTIIPMEKETYTVVDEDSDGVAEEVTYTYSEFLETSGLIKFDKNYDGLSAEEFIGVGFESLDTDENKLIDMKEWKRTYTESLTAPNADQDHYNK
jgi:hypothetical protein